MIRRFVGLAAVAVLAACQATVPSSPGPSAPTPTEPPLAAAGEAYIVTVLDDDRPFFDVTVEAIAPTGASRPIASFADAHPNGWESASPFYDMRATVASGRLLIVAERNGGMESDDLRTLILDLAGTSPTVEIDGAVLAAAWAPDGRLASLDDEPAVIDLRTGLRTLIVKPADVGLSPAWLADGSGWVADRYGENDGDPVHGWLSVAGVFTAGPAAPFQVTGRERFVGAAGGTLGYAITDGVGQSETALTEQRADLPGACHCIVWASKIDPGNAPGFGDSAWDAAGRGVWIVYTQGERRWLSHLTTPRVDSPAADLPPGTDWSIAGISTDDRWVVASSAEPGVLVLVDTVAGAAREIARVQGDVNPAPMFAGWVR
jgi:hypothetical protein